jgi:hypothetical protein
MSEIQLLLQEPFLFRVDGYGVIGRLAEETYVECEGRGIEEVRSPWAI